MIEATELRLAPYPRRISPRDGVFLKKDKRYMRLESREYPHMLIPAAKQTGLNWEITASPKAPKDRVGLVIRLDEYADLHHEGYKLTIRPDVIEIAASSPAGAFYGACTLKQILRQCGDELPCLSINDRPDFAARGVMLDISRDKVPTMETLYHLVDLFADWKINQLQLYTEHTFAYMAHPDVWKDASPVTGQQIMELDAYCRSKFIELVPNQNSFGHMERWLKFDQYRPMAEAPNGCDTIWGHFDYPFSLSPVDKRSIPFVRGLFDELLPHFTSRAFNVGLDETIDLGCGRSEKVCNERGAGRVYLDFLLDVYRAVKEHGRQMQFWGDIIIHHPELIPELPKDVIALEWGYEADHPFAEHGKQFAASGIEFYVCPGTSSWNTLCGRTENAVNNISNAAKNGLKNGSTGLLTTDWGDNGHWQPLSVSYLGFIASASASWNAKSDLDKNLADNLSLHAFNDPSLKIGRAFYDLGNVYLIFGKNIHNQSVPWQMLFKSMSDASIIEGLSKEQFDEMARRLEEIGKATKGEKMSSADAEIVREEFAHLLKVLGLSAQVGKLRLGGTRPKALDRQTEEVKRSHEHVWLLRNRPGGLSDSIEKMKFAQAKARKGNVECGGHPERSRRAPLCLLHIANVSNEKIVYRR